MVLEPKKTKGKPRKNDRETKGNPGKTGKGKTKGKPDKNDGETKGNPGRGKPRENRRKEPSDRRK